ncbi:hypothetical protein DL96DRAFT_1717617 [Flagelloscypha sp. PMI_526]|nr:hypothetical protein DL96DRAFT_1717617 [Flagelloscypha sp. PMI_526]
MSVFSPETLSNILSHLGVCLSHGKFGHRDSVGLDLHHCSLVHPSWTHESQAHLFQHPYVNWDVLKKFIDVLEASPHLTGHIRRLHVTFKEEQKGMPSSSLCFRLLNQLPAVVYLNVAWYIFAGNKYEGDRPPYFLLKASCLKYVKRLELCNVLVPSFEGIIYACPRLEHLNLWESNNLPEPWDIPVDEASASNKATRQASSLDISLSESGSIHRTLSANHGNLTPVPVTFLNIAGEHCMWKYYPAVHKLFGESVESIQIRFGYRLHSTAPKEFHDDCTNCLFRGIQFARFSKLTTIILRAELYARHWTVHIATLGQELHQLRKPGPLQSIVLKWCRNQDDNVRPSHIPEGCMGLQRERWEVFDHEATRLKIHVTCNYWSFDGSAAAMKEVVGNRLKICLVELSEAHRLSIL